MDLIGCMKSHPTTVGPEDTLLMAARLMDTYWLRELPVVDAEVRLLGWLTADALATAHPSGMRPEAPVRSAMQCVTALQETDSADTAWERLVRGRAAALPVCSGDQLVGVVSLVDILLVRLEDAALRTPSDCATHGEDVP